MAALQVFFATLAAFASSASAEPFIREVASFDTGAWIENIAVRSNGQLLVTRIDVPEVWAIDPLGGYKNRVAHFPGYASALGISELTHDVFAVIAGNFSYATGTTPGSYAIWTLDFRRTPRVAARKAADVPAAEMLNGLTTLDVRTVLAADPPAGAVRRVDLVSGTSTVALSGVEFSSPPDSPSPPAFRFGVNGVLVHGRALYFTNTGTSQLARVPIDASGAATGSVEALAGVVAPDDLTITHNGTVLVISSLGSTLDAVARDGTITHVVGTANSTLFILPTAVKLGRGLRDRQTAYVTNVGERDAAFNPLGPARILAIQQ